MRRQAGITYSYARYTFTYRVSLIGTKLYFNELFKIVTRTKHFTKRLYFKETQHIFIAIMKWNVLWVIWYTDVKTTERTNYRLVLKIKFSADDILKYYFLFCPRKSFEIWHLKCQNQFSRKNKKNSINVSSSELAQRVVSWNYPLYNSGKYMSTTINT